MDAQEPQEGTVLWKNATAEEAKLLRTILRDIVRKYVNNPVSLKEHTNGDTLKVAVPLFRKFRGDLFQKAVDRLRKKIESDIMAMGGTGTGTAATTANPTAPADDDPGISAILNRLQRVTVDGRPFGAQTPDPRFATASTATAGTAAPATAQTLAAGVYRDEPTGFLCKTMLLPHELVVFDTGCSRRADLCVELLRNAVVHARIDIRGKKSYIVLLSCASGALQDAETRLSVFKKDDNTSKYTPGTSRFDATQRSIRNMTNLSTDTLYNKMEVEVDFILESEFKEIDGEPGSFIKNVGGRLHGYFCAREAVDNYRVSVPTPIPSVASAAAAAATPPTNNRVHSRGPSNVDARDMHSMMDVEYYDDDDDDDADDGESIYDESERSQDSYHYPDDEDEYDEEDDDNYCYDEEEALPDMFVQYADNIAGNDAESECSWTEETITSEEFNLLSPPTKKLMKKRRPHTTRTTKSFGQVPTSTKAVSIGNSHFFNDTPRNPITMKAPPASCIAKLSTTVAPTPGVPIAAGFRKSPSISLASSKSPVVPMHRRKSIAPVSENLDHIAARLKKAPTPQCTPPRKSMPSKEASPKVVPPKTNSPKLSLPKPSPKKTRPIVTTVSSVSTTSSFLTKKGSVSTPPRPTSLAVEKTPKNKNDDASLSDFHTPASGRSGLNRNTPKTTSKKKPPATTKAFPVTARTEPRKMPHSTMSGKKGTSLSSKRAASPSTDTFMTAMSKPRKSPRHINRKVPTDYDAL